jgi:hypothetical protein
LTSNSAPPYDVGFRRRIIAMQFTQKVEYSLEERNEFEKLINERAKEDLKIVGDFAVNYILRNQNLILNDKKDWKEISKIILYEMYKVVDAEKQSPEWIEYIIENETQL